VTDPAAADEAERLLRRELDRLDVACSRFRPDSELVAANAAAGTTVAVSRLLADAVGVALDAARTTDGDVDPTLGASLVRLGYDRDFGELPYNGEPVALSVWRGSSWHQVDLDLARQTLRVPAGVQLDLGATAKAWCADTSAELIHRKLGVGVLVSLGGDLAVAGPPPADGWPVGVQERPHGDGPACTVNVRGGGVATSSTAARRWRRGGRSLHHLLDPATGMPAVSVWRTVTVAAPTCLAANVATTAAIVRSSAAVAGLRAERLPARLVSRTGEVTCLGGWPSDGASSAGDHEQR
jgi:FAD:protein FMN transferase